MLASVRFAAFFVLAPPFSHRAIPAQVKVALMLGLALAVSPRILWRRWRLVLGCIVAVVATTLLVYAYLPIRSAMVLSARQKARSSRMPLRPLAVGTARNSGVA